METIPEKTALKELGEQAMARAEEKEVKATGIKVRAAWFLWGTALEVHFNLVNFTRCKYTHKQI